jgi:hypothetical protein
VLLIDADRQASSAEWLEDRPIEGVEVVEAPSEHMLIRAMDRHKGTAFVRRNRGFAIHSEAGPIAHQHLDQRPYGEAAIPIANTM